MFLCSMAAVVIKRTAHARLHFSVSSFIFVLHVDRRRRWRPAEESTERTRVKTVQVPRSNVYTICRRWSQDCWRPVTSSTLRVTSQWRQWFLCTVQHVLAVAGCNLRQLRTDNGIFFIISRSEIISHGPRWYRSPSGSISDLEIMQKKFSIFPRVFRINQTRVSFWAIRHSCSIRSISSCYSCELDLLLCDWPQRTAHCIRSAACTLLNRFSNGFASMACAKKVIP